MMNLIYIGMRNNRMFLTALLTMLAAGNLQTGWALADVAGSPPGEATATVAEAEPAATSAKTSTMTLEQVQAAIVEAENRRVEESRPDPAITEAIAKSLAEQWGVEVISIRRTSAGYMLDFRFRVVDAEKALPLFDHRIKPYVLADKSQIKLPVPMAPKVGAFRPTNRGKNIKADRTYYMVFGNPDNYVKSGEKVSVVIGDFKAEHLTVN